MHFPLSLNPIKLLDLDTVEDFSIDWFDKLTSACEEDELDIAQVLRAEQEAIHSWNQGAQWHQVQGTAPAYPLPTSAEEVLEQVHLRRTYSRAATKLSVAVDALSTLEERGALVAPLWFPVSLSPPSRKSLQSCIHNSFRGFFDHVLLLCGSIAPSRLNDCLLLKARDLPAALAESLASASVSVCRKKKTEAAVRREVVDQLVSLQVDLVAEAKTELEDVLRATRVILAALDAHEAMVEAARAQKNDKETHEHEGTRAWMNRPDSRALRPAANRVAERNISLRALIFSKFEWLLAVYDPREPTSAATVQRLHDQIRASLLPLRRALLASAQRIKSLLVMAPSNPAWSGIAAHREEQGPPAGYELSPPQHVCVFSGDGGGVRLCADTQVAADKSCELVPCRLLSAAIALLEMGSIAFASARIDYVKRVAAHEQKRFDAAATRIELTVLEPFELSIERAVAMARGWDVPALEPRRRVV